MNKGIKKIGYLVSLCVVLLPLTTNALVAIATYESGAESLALVLDQEELSDVIDEREEFVEVIKELVEESKTVNIDEVIATAFTEAPQALLIELVETELEESSALDDEDLISLDTNIPVVTYEITESVSVTFDDNLVIVDEYEESAEEDVEELLKEKSISATALEMFDTYFFTKASAAPYKSKRKTASHTRHIYDTYIKNWKLVTAYISAEFTYNGEKVTARRTGNFMRANGLAGTLIEVTNRSSAIQKPSSKRRIAYQAGTAILGITIKGQGIVFQKKYLRVNVASNHHGTITKNSVLK